MESNGTIITQIGTKQQLFKDRETYPKALCDCIEDLISCNIAEIANKGGIGRIRFNNKAYELVVQLMVGRDSSRLSHNDKALVLIRMENWRIKSPVYYGIDCNIDFKSSSEVYALDTVENCVETLENFYSSWSVSKGSIGVVVIIVDNYMVFERIINHSLFKHSYILFAE